MNAIGTLYCLFFCVQISSSSAHQLTLSTIMSNPFGDLSSENADQIRRYLKFFRQKKEATLRSLNAEFADAIHDR